VVYRVGVTDVMNETEFKGFPGFHQYGTGKSKTSRSRSLPEIEALTKANWDAYKKGELNSKMKNNFKRIEIHRA
jgi:hypothetical protein